MTKPLYTSYFTNLVALLSIVAMSSYLGLGACSQARESYVNIIYSDNMDFTACVGGLPTPARLISLEMSLTEQPIVSTCPYVWWVPDTGGFPLHYFRYPPDMFVACTPKTASIGTFTGEMIFRADYFGYTYAEARVPLQAQIVDPSSDPFPGFTKNSGQDITFFTFSVPVGTPGLTTQVLQIVNQGGGTLTWDMVSDKPWLSVAPYQGDTTTEQDVVAVNVNVAGLLANTVEFGAITFNCNSPYVAQEKIYVVLLVTP